MTLKHCLMVGLLMPLFFVSPNQAQNNSNCGCDVTINPNTSNPSVPYRPWQPGRFGSNFLNVRPGQTICVTAGSYVQLRFNDFQGTVDSPIVIKNCGGLVTMNTTFYHAFALENCKYIKVTGGGDANTPYGFRVDGTRSGSSGLIIAGPSSDIEVERVEIAQASFAGIMAKADPTCNTNTWRDSFSMDNIRIHDNLIRNVGGEGLYLGNSFWNGVTRNCNGQNITVFPHRLLGLKVYNNIIRNTAWDGIQFGCAPNAEVYNNDLENVGTAGVSQQCNGIQMGAGSGGKLYNNVIRNARGAGIAAVGFAANSDIYNNLIVNALDGLFADTRDSIKTPQITLNVMNNTFVNIQNTGLKVYDFGLNYNVTNSNGSTTFVSFPKEYIPRLRNNVAIGPYFGVTILGGATARVDSAHSYMLRTPFSQAPQYFVAQKMALFADTLTYKLSSSSSLIDAGANVSGFGILGDLYGVGRPQGMGYDLGATEFMAQTAMRRTAANEPATPTLSLYPSIACDNVQIDIPANEKESVLTISNHLGQIVKTQKLTVSDFNQNLNVPVWDLPKGQYICTLRQGEQMHVAKFVKM